MKVTVIELESDRAVVVLRPSWIARLFGARELRCELKHIAPYWVTAGTGQMLGHVKHGSLIAEALDFAPTAEPPRAFARTKP